jgi:hypothetical protein
MFRKIIAICFFAGLLFQHLSRITILADYAMNRSYIANVLCENKSKPAMHCNGKCYLSKKLQQDEKNQAAGNQRTIPEIQLYVKDSHTGLTAPAPRELSTTYCTYSQSSTSITQANIFRPPVI